MRILLVEDEEHVATELSRRIGGLTPQVETIVARSRSSAIEALSTDEFDLIICDLRLPPYDGGVDTDEAHGLAVHSEARALCPGTPCLFFTGYATETNVRDQLSSAGTQDVFGTGESYGMTQLLTKDELRTCIERVEGFNRELETLAAISVDVAPGQPDLGELDERALRLLARPLGGTRVQVSPLGGRSGARTLRARVKDGWGNTLASYFAKIGPRPKILAEQRNYDRYVSPLLGIGAYPGLGRDIDAGIGKRKALFYQLADEYTMSLFDLVQTDEPAAMATIDSLRSLLAPWAALQAKQRIRVRELRSERIDDSAIQPFRGDLATSEWFEDMEREITTSCQHGDLHGLNVMCSKAGSVIVIDFGNVGIAPASIDPVLLELSVLFHIDSPFRANEWPTVAQAGVWFDLEQYLRGCPIPEFIRKCREWALETSGSDGLPPVVYAEAVRQLKYTDTNHERALAIARASIRAAS